MPDVKLISQNKYPVYLGDYVKDVFGDYYEVLSRDTFRPASENKVVMLHDTEHLILSPFSIIRRMITYGLLNSLLLLDAEAVLVEDLLDYYDRVGREARDLLSSAMKHEIAYDRRDNVGRYGKMLIYDVPTDKTLVSIPLYEWFNAYIEAIQDPKSTPENVARRLAAILFDLTEKHKNDSKEPGEEDGDD